MNAENLALIAGIVLSLAFSYIPGLNSWFQTLAKESKQALMGVLLLVVAVGIFAAQCAGLYDSGLVCSKDGAVGLVHVLILALVANQGAYSITK
jgi:hypothetical protein